MKSNYLFRYRKVSPTDPSVSPKESQSLEVSPLSKEDDPKVKKLKKVLSDLSITPPKQYIKIFK